jgi:hypothetical protein
MAYKVSLGGSGFTVGAENAKTLPIARKKAIALASRVPKSRSGRRPVGATVIKKLSANSGEVVAFYVPYAEGVVGEWDSEFDYLSSPSPREAHPVPVEPWQLYPEALKAVYQLAGRKMPKKEPLPPGYARATKAQIAKARKTKEYSHADKRHPARRAEARTRRTSKRGKFGNKNVVITGSMVDTRDKIAKALRSKGATVQSSVQESTDMLIVGSNPGRSKLDKAKSLGVPLVLSETLTRILGAGAAPKEAAAQFGGAAAGSGPGTTTRRFVEKQLKKKRTSKKPARRTSRKAAPKRRKPSAAKKRHVAERRAAVAKKKLKEFFWEDNDGRYGIVKASSKTDAKSRIMARGKRGVKIRTRIPSWY